MQTNVKASRVPRPFGRQGPATTSAKVPPVTPAKPHVNRKFCRTSQYMPPGSTKVGLAPNNQPAKLVWELDYGLSEFKFKALSERFPGIAFVQTGIDCHDHPIAHTSYRVVWRNVLSKLRPGQLVADISGNPDHNERFNKEQANRTHPIKIDTFCKVMSTKDSVRSKTRWGPAVSDKGVRRWEEVTVNDMYRFDENRQRFAGYDVFLMNHSLYYYTMSEVNQLLQLNPQSVLVATIHKLPGQNGEINCGEQRYEKDLLSGRVRQTNTETGEYYEHPDPAPWFSKFAYADINGAIAWTINKGCDDTYVVTITSTDPVLVEETCWLDGKVYLNNGTETVLAITPEGADPPPAYAVEEVVLQTSDLIPDYGYNKKKIVKITHPELYTQLKNFMINKPRNSQTLRDLTAKAHREAGNNTLLGGNQRVKITPEALTQHIAAAWVAGTGLEAEMLHFASARYADVAAVNRSVGGKALNLSSPTAIIKQCARFALIGKAVSSSKDPLARVLEHLDELL